MTLMPSRCLATLSIPILYDDLTMHASYHTQDVSVGIFAEISSTGLQIRTNILPVIPKEELHVLFGGTFSWEE
jgi:hypothetical protein